MFIWKPVVIAMLLGISVLAQPPAAKPDSPEVKAIVEQTKKTGGAMWADQEHFLCEAPRPNSLNDPVIAPTKIFDNVYAIGDSGNHRLRDSDFRSCPLMIDSLSAKQVN